MFLAVFVVSSVMVGAYMGRLLAHRGVTAENALQRYQRQIYCVSPIVLGFSAFLGVLLTSGAHLPWLPSVFLLYAEEYYWYPILGICCFGIGFLTLLEQSGWRNPKRLRQLLLFLMVSVIGIALLGYLHWPIAYLIGPPQIVEGIVLQTTPYTCSAATIATLSRQMQPELQTTELEVAKLAATHRQGSSTLAEIRAMKHLGLAPRFQRNLTVDDLVTQNQRAILHVMEPIDTGKTLHAIALLEIDPVKRTLTIANPLYGRQVKTFKDMKDHWIGEAVFVTMPS